MTLETTQLLQLKNVIRETPTILELADRSTIKPEGVIEDLIISVESWNYPADFVVLQTKAKLGGASSNFGETLAGYNRCFYQL